MIIRPKQWDRGNIYLSGGMQFAANLGAGWRVETSKKLKEMKYFPLDITDLKLIEEDSDALIVYYDHSARNGAGTVSEAQFAQIKNIPIFLVTTDYATEKDLFNNVSGWLIALCTAHFLSFEALYKYLDELPYGVLKKDIYGNHGVNGQYLCNLSGKVFTKKKHKFVSQIKPLYSQEAVGVVSDIYENHKDRYEFFQEYLAQTTDTRFKKD